MVRLALAILQTHARLFDSIDRRQAGMSWTGRGRPVRKLTGAAFVSLDGVVQAPGGPTEDPTGGFDLGGGCSGSPTRSSIL